MARHRRFDWYKGSEQVYMKRKVVVEDKMPNSKTCAVKRYGASRTESSKDMTMAMVSTFGLERHHQVDCHWGVCRGAKVAAGNYLKAVG